MGSLAVFDQYLKDVQSSSRPESSASMRTGRPFLAPLELFPRFSGDARLTQDSGQEPTAYVSLVGVRNPQPCLAPDHVLMIAFGVWAVEAEVFEVPDQAPPTSMDRWAASGRGAYLQGDAFHGGEW